MDSARSKKTARASRSAKQWSPISCVTPPLITHRQEHDWYLHSPCQAHGTLSTRYGEWQWQLLNLGTARITAVTGETFVLGDPREESSQEGD
jgi:hypothetical protein